MCIEEKGQGEKTVQKVKTAIPVPIYTLFRYYYTTGENGTDKKYVTFDGEKFVEVENEKDPPLFVCNVTAYNGKIMISERGDDEGTDIGEYYAQVEKAKTLIKKKNKESENDPSAKKYHIEAFNSDSREMHTDLTTTFLYELENGEGQKLAIIPPSDVFELGLGLSSDSDLYNNPNVNLRRYYEIVDMFFGSALVDGKLKKGLFYYFNDKLTEKYAYWEDPGSEKGSYGRTDTKKLVFLDRNRREMCVEELQAPLMDAKIREKFNSLLETRSPVTRKDSPNYLKRKRSSLSRLMKLILRQSGKSCTGKTKTWFQTRGW